MSHRESPDAMIEAFSRRIAGRFSRRSLLGQAGQGGIALAMGAAVAGGFAADPAIASYGCAENLSVTCGNLNGDNHCPSDTCNCGFWIVCGDPQNLCSGSQNVVWGDCCGGCSGGNACHCVAHDGTTSPSCCIPREWGQGCHQANLHVKCRVHSCTNTNCSGNC